MRNRLSPKPTSPTNPLPQVRFRKAGDLPSRRRTARKGGVLSSSPAAVRAGSGTVRNKIKANTRPGSPTATKASRHPNAWAMAPPNTAASAPPIGPPIALNEKPADLLLDLKRSEIMDTRAGGNPAPPLPTPMRHRSNRTKLTADTDKIH